MNNQRSGIHCYIWYVSTVTWEWVHEKMVILQCKMSAVCQIGFVFWTSIFSLKKFVGVKIPSITQAHVSCINRNRQSRVGWMLYILSIFAHINLNDFDFFCFSSFLFCRCSFSMWHIMGKNEIYIIYMLNREKREIINPKK